MKRVLAAALGFVLALIEPAGASQTDENKVLTFGIVPQQSASRLAKMWGPFLNELGKKTGLTFRFKTTKDIPTFEACLASGRYDIAYMNPMHYALFSTEAGYRAVARQSEKQLKGVIVARADSVIGEVLELDGRTIAFPSPGAFGASILTRSYLSQSGVAFDPSYVRSHDSVYRAVAAGLVPAGGGVARTLNATDPAVRDQLRIIHETQGFTPHAFAVHPDLTPDQAQAIQNAMIDMATDQPELVTGIGMRGLDPAQDADWDDVRALSMTRAETGILEQGSVSCPSG